MFVDRCRARTITASIAIGVSSVSGFAQSNAVRWSTTSPESTDAGGGRDVVAIYRAAHAVSLDVDIPPNLSFPSIYRSTIESLLRRSEMFRRQCLRLAAAPYLSVTVKNGHFTAGPRARTTIKRLSDNRLSALVEIHPLGDLEELIAHELEHIIEQLDGVDLSELAELRGTGVRTCGDGTFETLRAIRIGRLVAQQARNGR